MEIEQIIKNYEQKISQLVKLQNKNNDSGDMSSFALRDYCERQEKIERLKLSIKLLEKRLKQKEV